MFDILSPLSGAGTRADLPASVPVPVAPLPVPVLVPGLPVPVLAILGAGGAVPDVDAIEFTLIASTGTATKSYSVEAGKLKKSGEPPLTAGTAYRAYLLTSTPLALLAAALEAFPAYVVLTPGAMTAQGNALRITTKARLANELGAITRTRGWARYRPGRPGVAMLDHDAKDLDLMLLARQEAAGGLVAVLASVCPEFARAGLLERASVSTGIRVKSNGAVSPGGGRHLYFVAANGSDIKRFIECLHQRLILAGWG